MEAGFYAIKTIGATLGGVSGAFEVELLGVAKHERVEPHSLANEFICSQLAAALGLPAPPSTIATTDTGEKLFVSLRFSVGSMSLPPIDPAELVADRPTLAAGITVFDCWVGNWDRHAGNIAYVRGVSGVSMFDHGRTLLRPPTGEGEAAMRAAGDEPHIYAQSALLPHLSSVVDLGRWSERIKGLPDDLVREVSEAAQRLDLVTASEAAAVADILNQRKKRLMDYLAASSSLMTSINPGDWSSP